MMMFTSPCGPLVCFAVPIGPDRHRGQNGGVRCCPALRPGLRSGVGLNSRPSGLKPTSISAHPAVGRKCMSLPIPSDIHSRKHSTTGVRSRTGPWPLCLALTLHITRWSSFCFRQVLHGPGEPTVLCGQRIAGPDQGELELTPGAEVSIFQPRHTWPGRRFSDSGIRAPSARYWRWKVSPELYGACG